MPGPPPLSTKQRVIADAIRRWVAALDAATTFKHLHRISGLIPSDGVRLGNRQYDRHALARALAERLDTVQDLSVGVGEIETVVRRKQGAAHFVLEARWRDVDNGRPGSARLRIRAVVAGRGMRLRRLTVSDVAVGTAVGAAEWSKARAPGDPAPPDHPASRAGSMLVLTVASYAHPGLDDLRASCQRFGATLQVIGRGAPWRGSSHNKLRDLLRFLRFEGRGYRRVLYTDAFDSIVVRPPDEIVATFDTMSTPLLMSAEANCFPASPGQGREDYPPSPTPFAYVNAGGFLGEVDYLREMIDRLKIDELAEGGSDQGWWAGMYVSGRVEMKLDHHCRIFQCLHSVPANDIVIEDRIRNRVTGTYPAVIHANGRVSLSRFLDHALGEPWPGARFVRRARTFVWRRLVRHTFGRWTNPFPAGRSQGPGAAHGSSEC